MEREKSTSFYSLCLNLWLRTLEFSEIWKLLLWQLLKDLEASPGVFSCAWRFTATATATRIKCAVGVVSQPGAVGTVRIFEAHHITVLYRCTIISVLGVDLESGVGIGQPGASCHRTGDSTNTKMPHTSAVSVRFSQPRWRDDRNLRNSLTRKNCPNILKFNNHG